MEMEGSVNVRAFSVILKYLCLVVQCSEAGFE
jgi:hypothetical protein